MPGGYACDDTGAEVPQDATEEGPHRPRAAAVRESRKPLAHAEHLAEFLVEPIEALCDYIHREYCNNGNWEDLKELSFLGYGVYQGRAIDHGNVQYKA